MERILDFSPEFRYERVVPFPEKTIHLDRCDAMEAIWSSIHTHQFAVITVIAVSLLVIYFLFKNLIKLALLFVLILILAGGYFYLTAPAKSPADLDRAIKKTREQTGQLIDKGKVAYEKGKEVVRKGKELTDNVGKVIGSDRDGPRKE
ncbi:MAG TPA: hypothetical protein PK175_03765 [Syntrophales bacterium]|nr:hypothetical protein [Syntrophales bacterium]HOU77339.1 hypothetical protein [Syntrophales bacterium]HPC32658.1 hypothetical protein [Syntrophales bacterium]HQG33972.1 hypothetical protein [Syntrophales bacterium]HQI35275.1 hypothetical protein [Syntrophales bacterium]